MYRRRGSVVKITRRLSILRRFRSREESWIDSTRRDDYSYDERELFRIFSRFSLALQRSLRRMLLQYQPDISPLFIFRENARSLLACNVVRTRLDRNSVPVETNRTVRTWWNREKRCSKEREKRKRKRKRREAAGSSCGATSFVVIVRRHYRSSSRRIFRISEVTRNNVTVYRLSAVRAVIRVSRFAKISGLSIPFSWPRSQT